MENSFWGRQRAVDDMGGFVVVLLSREREKERKDRQLTPGSGMAT